jgi:hypothetical protein
LNLSFTATGSVFTFAIYNTSSGSTGVGSGWTQIVGGNPGIANSAMFEYVVEYQIVMSPSALSATLTSGTQLQGIGDALVN